jgi:hypothetical protein
MFTVTDATGRVHTFDNVLAQALDEGIRGVALLDRHGTIVASAGEIGDDEAMPIAALVLSYAKRAPSIDKLRKRLFSGELLSEHITLGDVAVGVAGRQLFIVALLGDAPIDVAIELRRDVEQLLIDVRPLVPPGRGGGSSGGPSEMELIELGITVPRAKA